MCVMSMIGDHYGDKWVTPQQPNFWPVTTPPHGPTKKDFDELKKEVLEMKELLKKAKIYDEENNQPECEIEEKMEKLRKVAELVGVDLDDVIGKGE